MTVSHISSIVGSHTIPSPWWASEFSHVSRLSPAYLVAPNKSVSFLPESWMCVVEEKPEEHLGKGYIWVGAPKVNVWFLPQADPYSPSFPPPLWQGPGTFTLEFPKFRLVATAVYDTTWYPGYYHLLKDGEDHLYTVYSNIV